MIDIRKIFRMPVFMEPPQRLPNLTPGTPLLQLQNSLYSINKICRKNATGGLW
jgi:hypothetical protein